ncbi:hypothetical protein [Streptomyces sp. NPDC060243]|uniref:hypothetical protein n=1 Tax=Streptomyces sp. NPDC060243 TaxID=3347081 RepID=UPI003663112A
MTLDDLIQALSAADKTTVVKRGFRNPHSYRGFYDDLAFEPTMEPVTVGEMLADAISADGATYTGYKGGEFTMRRDTHCWLAMYGSASEQEITPGLLAEMLADTVTPEAPLAPALSTRRAYFPPFAEHEQLIRAALRVIEATHYPRDNDPHADAEQEYSDEQLALAARAFTDAVNALPADEQPIGWGRER